MALELKTTRGADDALTTTTPGAPGGGGGDFLGGDIGGLLQKILKRRFEDQLYDLEQGGRPISGIRPGSAADRERTAAAQRAEAQRVAAQQRAAPSRVQAAPARDWGAVLGNGVAMKPKEYTRQRPIPFPSMFPGNTQTTMLERYLPGIGWEFNGLYPMAGGGAAPSYGGGSGMPPGIPGIANSGMSIAEAQKDVPGRPSGYQTPDARGPGYGHDYGK